MTPREEAERLTKDIVASLADIISLSPKLQRDFIFDMIWESGAERRKKAAHYQRDRFRLRKALRICRNCKRPTYEGTSLCQEHYTVAKLADVARKEDRVRRGLCKTCGKKKGKSVFLNCVACRLRSVNYAKCGKDDLTDEKASASDDERDRDPRDDSGPEKSSE